MVGMDGDDESRVAAVRARIADLFGDEPTPAEIALIRRLLRSFEDRTAATAGTLIGLLDDGDPGLVRDQAHALKGSAANIGATALAGLCAAVEDEARAGTVADPAATADRVRAEVAGALRAVSVTAAEFEI
ncbi:Hpt domain-containing protein [Actinoplanes sp. NEAU-A11]|uniref:Hpt domain-containing protein n=2 Tax=Actinoplanes aureus TaxID=2792083 RepID=A0A931C0J5_9ACTN|nr:Hpt domain-containing protein [Actinoplanes aureus]